MKKLFSRTFCLIFFLQVISPAALAEQLSFQAPDIESPSIKFDVGDTKIFDGMKTFSAEVTDNVAVSKVTLYYKGVNDFAFIPKQMVQGDKQSDIYSVEIAVDSIISNKLEIYIKAEDVSGNSIFEGQKFLPLTYDIAPRDSKKVISIGTEPAEEEGMSTLTMILIGVGVAALAGAAGGGGGGGSDPAPSGTIIITAPTPD